MVDKLKSSQRTEFGEAYREILNYFFSFPNTAIGLNDLSSSVSFSKTTTKNIVIQLIREGFLQKEEIGKAWRISTVKNHPYFITRKIPINLMMIYEQGIVDFIREKYPGSRAIVLFGSYRWGSDNEDSDIDIAVELISNTQPMVENIGEISFLYRKKAIVNLFVFSRNKVDLNVFNNIANGIVLDGFLEVRT